MKNAKQSTFIEFVVGCDFDGPIVHRILVS